MRGNRKRGFKPNNTIDSSNEENRMTGIYRHYCEIV